MTDTHALRDVPAGWPDAARYDDAVYLTLRQIENIKAVLAKVERVLLDPDGCAKASTASITRRNLRTIEYHLVEAWNLELHGLDAALEAAREKRKVAERVTRVGAEVDERGTRVAQRFTCGRIDLDMD